MTQNMLPRLNSGKNLPDLFFILSTNWQPWAAKGMLEPLDDIYEETIYNGSTVRDMIVEGARDFGKVNDHYWVLPWTLGPAGIIYNKGMFEQYGWEIPTTFTELVQLCEDIKTDTANTVAPFAWSGQTAGYWDMLVFQWWAQTEGEDGWKEFWRFESPEVFNQNGRLQALKAFEQLICGEGGVAINSIEGAASKEFMAAQMSFVKGEAAMMVNGSWIESEMQSQTPENFEMRLMPTPVIEGAADPDIAYVTMGDFAGIPAGSTKKEAAKKFLKYTCTKEANDIFVQTADGLRPFTYPSEEVEGVSDFLKDVIEQYKACTPAFMTSNNVMYYQNNLNAWPGYGTPYGKMVQEEDSAEDVMAAIYEHVSSNWEAFQQEAGEI
jgi:N-acetylglucosamine transport system substrate-binding protein